MQWTPASALLLNALVLAVTIPVSARFRREALARKDVVRTRYDLPLRAAAAALVVAVVTTASHRIGPFASGTLAVFPIVMGTFVVILHLHAGGKAAGAVFAHAQLPLIGLCLGFLAIHYLAEPIGVWWSYRRGSRRDDGVEWNFVGGSSRSATAHMTWDVTCTVTCTVTWRLKDFARE